MLEKIRSNIFVRYFLGLIVLLILNSSVDTPDVNNYGVAENLNFNDQETILELIFEKVLLFEDAFIEVDDSDNDDEQKGKSIQHFYWFLSEDSEYFKVLTTYKLKNEYHDQNEQLLNYCSEIHSPPPELKFT